MLSEILSLEGHECIVSNNGRNGLVLLESQKFDVTLLDLSMPEFSGYDVIDALEKNEELKYKKIIVLTASSISNDESRELKNRGVHAVLKKPVDPLVLLATIKS